VGRRAWEGPVVKGGLSEWHLWKHDAPGGEVESIRKPSFFRREEGRGGCQPVDRDEHSSRWTPMPCPTNPPGDSGSRAHDEECPPEKPSDGPET
jgi:hypothetical protein